MTAALTAEELAAMEARAAEYAAVVHVAMSEGATDNGRTDRRVYRAAMASADDRVRLLAEVARQRDDIARLTAALDEAQHSSSMACIDADPDCDCAGCLYARHHNVDGGGR